ncbi:MAG: Holliday junction resolvase RuvX [Solitalea-like symbiont of Acarus siro]
MDNNDYTKLEAGRILAIDYGLKRVGLAVSNIERSISFPLETVSENEAIPFIEKYIEKTAVAAFIIGLPLTLKGEESDFTIHVKKFSNQLSKKFQSIPIDYIDERFTSKIASQIVLNLNLTKTARQDKKRLDNISAALIVQSSLDRHSTYITK